MKTTFTTVRDENIRESTKGVKLTNKQYNQTLDRHDTKPINQRMVKIDPHPQSKFSNDFGPSVMNVVSRENHKKNTFLFEIVFSYSLAWRNVYYAYAWTLGHFTRLAKPAEH